MKNEYDKMTSGELYDYTAPETSGSWFACRERLRRFNSEMPYGEGYRAALRDLIPSIPDTSAIYPPFQCDHGTTIRMGENVIVNMNCVFLDSGGISIGDHTLIGPSCGLYTPQHPVDYIERRKTVERGLKITIGSDCWLGGGVTVCPGVTIGDRCIIAAGSVVVHDIPDDSLAAGNPAVVKRKLNGTENKPR